MNFSLTEEQRMIQEMCRRFAENEVKPVAARLDETHEHPADLCRKMGELGLWVLPFLKNTVEPPWTMCRTW